MAGIVTRRSCPACSRPCHTQRITHATTQQTEQRQQRSGGFDGWQSHAAFMPCIFASLPHTEDHTRGDSAEGAAKAAETRVRWLAESRGLHALHFRVPATQKGSHTRRLRRKGQRQQWSRGFDGWQSHLASMCCIFAPLPHTEDHTRGDSADRAATVVEPRVRWLAKSRSFHVLHVRHPATHKGSHTRRLSRGSGDSSGDVGSRAGKVTRRSCAACSRACRAQRTTHARRFSRGSSDSNEAAGSMAGKVTKRSCAAYSRPCHTQRITHAATQQREQRQQRRRGFDGWQGHAAFMCCISAYLPRTVDHTRSDSAEGAATAAGTRV